MESLAAIESMKKHSNAEAQTEYIMDIFLREPLHSTMPQVKNKIALIDSQTLGEELKVSFRSPNDEPNQSENLN